MKMTYKEFNELQEQQMIRDTSQRAWNELNLLNELIDDKRTKKSLNEMMKYVFNIQNKSIENIRNMIEGENDETN